MLFNCYFQQSTFDLSLYFEHPINVELVVNVNFVLFFQKLSLKIWREDEGHCYRQHAIQENDCQT